MRTSEKTGELVKALITAKRAFQPIVKTKTAKAGSFTYDYADRAVIIEATQSALGDNGLAIIHTPDKDDSGELYLYSRLAHVSDQWVECRYPLPPVSNQQMGSALTYGERYNTNALLDISADSDDDGAAAEKGGPKLPPKPDVLLSSLKTMAKEAASSGKLTEFRESGEVKAQAGMLSPAHLAEFKQVIRDLDGLAK